MSCKPKTMSSGKEPAESCRSGWTLPARHCSHFIRLHTAYHRVRRCSPNILAIAQQTNGSVSSSSAVSSMDTMSNAVNRNCWIDNWTHKRERCVFNIVFPSMTIRLVSCLRNRKNCSGWTSQSSLNLHPLDAHCGDYSQKPMSITVRCYISMSG